MWNLFRHSNLSNSTIEPVFGVSRKKSYPYEEPALTIISQGVGHNMLLILSVNFSFGSVWKDLENMIL